MKKKPSVALVLGLGKPRPDEEEEEGSSGTYSEEERAMASELLEAIEDKDIDGIIGAFKGLYESCVPEE